MMMVVMMMAACYAAAVRDILLLNWMVRTMMRRVGLIGTIFSPKGLNLFISLQRHCFFGHCQWCLGEGLGWYSELKILSIETAMFVLDGINEMYS